MPDQTNAEVSDERLRELLPCAFCGAENRVHVGFIGNTEFYLTCGNCGAHGPLMLQMTGSTIDLERGWNRRSVTSQASEGEVAWQSLLDDMVGVAERLKTMSRMREHTVGARESFGVELERHANSVKVLSVAFREILRAPVSKRVERLETGWLIEINSRSTGPTWFSMSETEGNGGFFTKDSLKALRFGRKEDAQAYIDDIGWTEAIPTEHEWGCDGRQAQGLALTAEAQLSAIPLKVVGHGRDAGRLTRVEVLDGADRIDLFRPPSQPAAVGVTDEMVVAACKAYEDRGWQLSGSLDENHRQMRAALEAALRSTP